MQSSRNNIWLALLVIAIGALLAGLGVLLWWLIVDRHEISTNILLEGTGLGDVQQTAALTRLGRAGEMFWWFFPTLASAGVARPIILWLDGVTGLPPSAFANFGMFGPLDFNRNKRNDSWINEYNLLFVDAPIGTGFSKARTDNRIPQALEENANHLVHVLRAFYTHHEAYQRSPLYIFGQGHGAQLAVSLAIQLTDVDFSHNLQGVVLGNGIISPALALTKLGFYLEEMGYIDATGRAVIEGFSAETNRLVNNEDYEEAYDKFLSLGRIVEEEAGTVAVNLRRITDKLVRNPSAADYFGQKNYLRSMLDDVDINKFMMETVAPSLGISITFDAQRDAVVNAFRSSFMVPTVDKVEYILSNTSFKVAIYNGNLDAVSTTPGQLEWIDNLEWSGQDAFRNSERQPIAVNSLLQGYFRETERLTFYWINAAGQSVPLDSPEAAQRILQKIIFNI
ncbi:retinoid-inducible serine carboxypeptidase-like [Hyposmocoma kahamanoa]|uniref:retinoid-inducible serine carboxypeptidase-like n=1 Tax=Hyposmocoma kahamanoa TaxID=1477025 RepID=UPI000E6D90AA|nr:retinoid-inducible serine carboxypeptidase-like [Hyposmocoma kahamanoa]